MRESILSRALTSISCESKKHWFFTFFDALNCFSRLRLRDDFRFDASKRRGLIQAWTFARAQQIASQNATLLLWFSAASAWKIILCRIFPKIVLRRRIPPNSASMSVSSYNAHDSVLERQIRHFGYKIHQNLIKNDVLSSKSTFEIQNQALKTLFEIWNRALKTLSPKP